MHVQSKLHAFPSTGRCKHPLPTLRRPRPYAVVLYNGSHIGITPPRNAEHPRGLLYEWHISWVFFALQSLTGVEVEDQKGP